MPKNISLLELQETSKKGSAIIFEGKILGLNLQFHFSLDRMFIGLVTREPPAQSSKSSWRGDVPIPVHHHGTSGQSVPGWTVVPHHLLPHRLFVQISQGGLHNKIYFCFALNPYFWKDLTFSVC